MNEDPSGLFSADPRSIAILEAEMLQDFVGGATLEDLRRHAHLQSFVATDENGVLLGELSDAIKDLESGHLELANEGGLLESELARRCATTPLIARSFHLRVVAETLDELGSHDSANGYRRLAEGGDRLLGILALIIAHRRSAAEMK